MSDELLADSIVDMAKIIREADRPRPAVEVVEAEVADGAWWAILLFGFVFVALVFVFNLILGGC